MIDTELGALQATSVLAVLLLCFALFWVGVAMWNANGARPLLRLLASKLAVNTYIASAVCAQTLFETRMVSHEPVTWHFQWVTRIGFCVIAVLYIVFSEEIRPTRGRRNGRLPH